MADSIPRELAAIRSMPFGTARTSAVEAVAHRVEADESLHEHLPEALLDLVEAYTFTFEGAKAFVVFARLLRVWDERPELFDPVDRRNMFWEFKWIAGDLSEYPQITADQAKALLEDMERRFNLAGNGLSAVRMSYFQWARNAGLPEAESARQAWLATPRDEFDDCKACSIGQQVEYLTETGRYEEAVEIGRTQEHSCNLEPTHTLHYLALAALLTDQPELSAKAYRRALATLDASDEGTGPSRGVGFETLARGGQLERALLQLRNDYPGFLRAGSTPLAHLRFLLGIVAGLSANLDQGDLPTGLDTLSGAGPESAEWSTVASLREWTSREALALAEQFDTRSGTSYYHSLLERALSATRASMPLSFDEESPAEAIATPRSTPDANPGEVHLEWAEAAAGRQEFSVASQHYQEAASALEADGWLEKSGLAYAEAAQCAALIQEDQRAHSLFSAAVPRLRSGNADAAVLVAVLEAWARTAARVGQSSEQIQATASLLGTYQHFDSARLAPDLAERKQSEWSLQRATLRDTLARSIASAPAGTLSPGLDLSRAIAEATTAGEEFAHLGKGADAAHAFWLAGRLQRDAGKTADAIWSLESAFEGFTAVRARDQRAEVAGELIELLRSSGQPERAEEIVSQLTA